MEKKSVLGTLSIVFGVVGIFTGCFGIGIIFAIAALILGIIALVKGAVGTQKTLSILGIIFSVLVIFVAIIGGKALLSTFGESTNEVKDQVIEQTKEETKTTKEETTKKATKLEAVDVQWVEENYFTYLVGTIENTKDKKISYISVKFILYDANGNQVGTTSDYTTDLGAGAKWSFKAAVWEDEAVSFKLEEISAW